MGLVLQVGKLELQRNAGRGQLIGNEGLIGRMIELHLEVAQYTGNSNFQLHFGNASPNAAASTKAKGQIGKGMAGLGRCRTAPTWGILLLA